VLKFWCRGQIDDFLAEAAIPEQAAIDAAVEFMVEGRVPSSVRWEADWEE
jgi:hypothetical protein